jgi:hypothetical protein
VSFAVSSINVRPLNARSSPSSVKVSRHDERLTSWTRSRRSRLRNRSDTAGGVTSSDRAASASERAPAIIAKNSISSVESIEPELNISITPGKLLLLAATLGLCV